MHTQIKEKLYQDVEGTCSGRYGYIITVLSLSNISKGKVLPGSGLAEFKVNYQAIVFKPYKGEVLDAIVTTVNKVNRTQWDREYPHLTTCFCVSTRWVSLPTWVLYKFLYPAM